MRKVVGVALVCVGLVVAGCGAGSDREAKAIISEVDGVLHVQLPARLPGGVAEVPGVPDWGLRELYNTSSSGSDIELFRVTAARFLGDGTLAIANSGSNEILLLDDDGALRRRVGRAGSGPGEFGWIATLDLDADGNLLVYDPREVRLTRMAPTGEVVEARRLSSGTAVIDIHPLAELEDGRIMAVFSDVRVFHSSGEARDTVPLVVVDPAGAPWDTIGSWPAQEWAFFGFSGGSSRTQVGFGRNLAYAGRGGRAVLASTDSLDLSVFDATGSVAMRITGWGAIGAVSPADAERWRNQLVEQRSRAPEEIRRWLESAPFRGTYPAFKDLLVDDEGRVWIGGYPRGDQAQSWLIIGGDGRLEGRLEVPGGATLLDAAGGRVAMLRRTELDEEYVVVLEIVR